MNAFCTSCEEPCDVVVVDFGIGPYEFWGATGWDRKLDAVSNCCEARAETEDGVSISLADYENEFDGYDD